MGGLIGVGLIGVGVDRWGLIGVGVDRGGTGVKQRGDPQCGPPRQATVKLLGATSGTSADWPSLNELLRLVFHDLNRHVAHGNVAIGTDAERLSDD